MYAETIVALINELVYGKLSTCRFRHHLDMVDFNSMGLGKAKLETNGQAISARMQTYDSDPFILRTAHDKSMTIAADIDLLCTARTSAGNFQLNQWFTNQKSPFTVFRYMTSEPDRTTSVDRSTNESDSHGTTVRSSSDPNTQCLTAAKRLKSDDDINTYAPKPYQDLPFDRNSARKSGYIDFSSNPSAPSESILPSSLASAPVHSNDIHQMLTQASLLSTHSGSDGEDDAETLVVTAKKLLFPSSLASSFPEVAQTLRNERRQEFCPIYTDETPEQVTLRQAKRKPVGSLLAKRIRWDELKRQREAADCAAQMPFHYNSYGPAHNQQQASFTNPYEQYYTAMQHQHDEVRSSMT